MEDVDVYFDDLTITHTGINIIQSTDYYPPAFANKRGGLVMPARPAGGREQKNESYRFGYQGQFAELDPATGWNYFELRQYDAVEGRWLVVDPARQFYSPYEGMGNDPITGFDPTGGKCPTCPEDSKYDIYKNTDQPFAYDEYSDIVYTNWGEMIVSPNQSKFNDFIFLLSNWASKGDAWMNSFSGPDNSWDGLYGIEFYSTTDIHGIPSYWLRSGTALYGISDAGYGLAVFKGPKGRMFKLDLRTPRGTGNMSTIKKITTTLEYGSNGADILIRIVEQTSQVHGGYSQVETLVGGDSIITEIFRNRGDTVITTYPRFKNGNVYDTLYRDN